MIFTNLAPNTQGDDAWLALRLLFVPWKHKRGPAAEELEKAIARRTSATYAISFESGRTSLLAILAAAGIKAGDEVLLQAYTCVAVPDPVLWAGATPIYVDCDDSLTMSPADLEKKITPRAKALIIQHTFGMPANIDVLLEIARKHNLFVIEDCAHALGALYGSAGSPQANKPVGSFGDAAFFSFGRDKTISSVFGGMATTNDTELAQKIRTIQESYPLPAFWWVKQQLQHPVLMWLGKKTYTFGGKIIIGLSKALRATSRAVYPVEKIGGKPRFAGKQFANALALLALHQLEKLDRFNEHRKKIATIYERELSSLSINYQLSTANSQPIWLRYTIWTEKAAMIKIAAAKRGILLGDWYDAPIAPRGVSYEKIGYKLGSCPNAERISSQTLNLPTDIHVTEEDAKRIAAIVIASTKNQ